MNKKDIGVWLILAALLVLMRWPFLGVPLERDEGEYAYCAWQMRQGGMPYRDIVTSVSPGIFFLYRFCFALFGDTVKDIRLFTMWYLILTLIMFYYVARRRLGIFAALAASLVFVFLTTDPSILACMSNRETFMLLPLLLSFLCLEFGLATGQRRWFIILGLINALAFMLKQTAIFNIFFILAVCGWHYYQKKEYRLFWQGLGLVAGGFVSGISIFVFYFYSQHALRDFYYWVFIHPRIMSEQLRWGGCKNIAELWWVLKSIFSDGIVKIITKQFPLNLLAAVSILAMFGRREKKDYVFFVWLLFMLCGVVTGWRLRRHYFQLLTVPAALLCGCLFAYIKDWIEAHGRARVKPLYYGGILVTVGIPLFLLLWNYSPLNSAQISKKIYGIQVFSVADTISRYVVRQTKPTEPLYILGSEQEIYFYSKRKCVDEYITAYALTYNYGDPRARQEAVATALKKQLPPVIIKINQSTSLFDMPAVNSENLIFLEVFKLVAQQYILDGVIYIKADSDLIIFGQKKIEEITGQAATTAEKLRALTLLTGFAPDVLIFKKKV